jgi:hypothetical protein
MPFLPYRFLAQMSALVQPMRNKKALAFAFALSLAMHLSIWFAIPPFNFVWQVPSESSFDAVLAPFAKPPPTSVAANVPEPRKTPRPVRAAAVKKPTPRADTPESIANFVPPANAIAVERPRRIYTEDLVPANVTQDSDSASENSEPTAVTDANPPKSDTAAQTPSTITETTPTATGIEPPPLELPARIAIAYQMSSSVSDGVADYSWKRDGDRFEIDSSMQATGFIVGNLIGVLHQVSRGVVTSAGLQPETFQIRRGEALPDTAEFLRGSNELKLTRAGNARMLPLPPQIQDMQSFLFQLAIDAPKLRNPDDQLEVQVTNGRKVYRHRFRQVGLETLQTRSGPVQVMHLRSDAIEAEDTYEVWLATDRYHLPVKIKFFAGRFPVELIAASIRTTP